MVKTVMGSQIRCELLVSIQDFGRRDSGSAQALGDRQRRNSGCEVGWWTCDARLEMLNRKLV